MSDITLLDAILIPWVVLGLFALGYLLDKYILIPRMKRKSKLIVKGKVK